MPPRNTADADAEADEGVLHALRCPASGAPLVRSDGALATADGSHTYVVLGGVPVLLPPGSPFTVDASPSGRPRRRRGPRAQLGVGASERYASFAAALREAGPASRPARVLVVGGGDLGEGLGVLTADPGVELVETDVYLGPRVGVVCDAHALPFADGAFDGVVIQAVLEHLLDPVRAVAEIHRVLAPGGLVYAETPFMQQVHEGAYDFTRWTALGHRRLFRWFDELDSGVAVGPASALVWSVRYFARSLPRSVTMARVLDRVATLAVFWLKYLDRWLVSHPGAHDAASSVYFCGRRRDEPIGDDELVAGYRGTVRSAAATRGVTGST